MMTMQKTILVFLLFAVMPAAAGPGYAAPAAPVEIVSVEITPESPSPDQQPEITARIGRTTAAAPTEQELFTIIAVVTKPDNITKSWTWKNVLLMSKEPKSFQLPKVFDTKLVGRYKVEYNVYSADMLRRYASTAKSFSVGPVVKPVVPVQEPQRPPAERYVLGLGVSGNAANPAGGGTILLWPFRNVGLQGTYTVGTFTSYEGRLVVRFEGPSGFNPYIAAGFLGVSVDKDIIGVTTTFRDSSLSGAVGIEAPLGRRVRGFAEVGGTAIDLQKTVTNGPQTVKATVDYSLVTFSAGIVFYLF